MRRYVVSDASVHDSQKFEDVLDTSNTASDVWADGAYRSDEIEEKLAERGLKSRIHHRAYRNRKLSEAQKAANMTRSKVRARVEHVFGDQKNGLCHVRGFYLSIGRGALCPHVYISMPYGPRGRAKLAHKSPILGECDNAPVTCVADVLARTLRRHLFAPVRYPGRPAKKLSGHNVNGGPR